MTWYFDNAAVQQLCDASALVAAIEKAYVSEAAGRTRVPERQNLGFPGSGAFRLGGAVLPDQGVMGFKAFHSSAAYRPSYLVTLYSQASGELLAIFDGRHITAARTGATAAVATKHLAPRNVTTMAVLGSGDEARTQVAATLHVRMPQQILVFSPREASRERFAADLRATFDVDAKAVDRPEDAVRDAQLVVAATRTSRSAGTADPEVALEASWFTPGRGVHVSSIGSSNRNRRELATQVFADADLVGVDSPAQACEESADVVAALDVGAIRRQDLRPLADVVTGRSGRTGDDATTVFKSVGSTLQDVAAAHAVYQVAVASGVPPAVGRDLGELLSRKDGG